MRHLYFLILTFWGPLLLFAQTTKPNPPPFTYKVTTIEGVEYSGTIITVNTIAISLQQNKERINVKKDEIETISLTGEWITDTGTKQEIFQKIWTVDEKSFKGQLISYNGTDYTFLTHKDHSIARYLYSPHASKQILKERTIPKSLTCPIRVFHLPARSKLTTFRKIILAQRRLPTT